MLISLEYVFVKQSLCAALSGGCRCSLLHCLRFIQLSSKQRHLFARAAPASDPPPQRRLAYNGWLVTTMQFLFDETGSDQLGTNLIRQHLTDILFVQILRTWTARQQGELPGWLQALHDEHIRKAIAAIHEEPGAEWTVERLAQKAGLGRAAFAALHQARR